MSDPTEDWFDRRDDPTAKRALVQHFDGLAVALARRFRGRGEELDDLEQVARFALVKAIDRFDTSRDVQFSTYATKSILGELKRHLRDKAWSVRVPRSLQERWLQTNRAVEELTQRLGRSPSIGEIAGHLDLSPEEVLDAMDAGSAYSAASLDAPVGGDGESASLGELIPVADDVLGGSDDRATLSEHLEALPERERTAIYLRFFEGKSQREIGEVLGVSQMHVSRILRQTLDDLRELIETH